MPTIIREETTPLYDDKGKLVAYQIDTYTVNTPPAKTPTTTTHRRLHTATPTTPPRQLTTSAPVRQPAPRQTRHAATPTTPPRTTATPARQPTPSPVAFLSKHMGRVVTLTHCLKCQKTHASCQCWPSGSARQLAAEAAAANAPRERPNTFEKVVEWQRANGILPGTPQPAPATTGAGVPRRNTLEEVVRLQKLRGLR